MAIVHTPPAPRASTAPPWDADNRTAKELAEFLHRRGVTAGEAYGAVPSCPEYLPVAEALEGLSRSADAGVAAILKAARR